MWHSMRENLFRERQRSGGARAGSRADARPHRGRARDARSRRSATGRTRPMRTAALGDRALTVVGDRDPFVPSRMRGASIPTRSCSPAAATWPVSSVRRSSGSSSTRRWRDGRRPRRGRAAARRGGLRRPRRAQRGRVPGETTAPCDPRPAGSPARSTSTCSCCSTLTPDEISERLGPPEDVELVAYCHSGSRSELAAQILRARRVPGLELPRLLARVVAGRLAACPRPARRPAGRPSRACGRARSSPRCALAASPPQRCRGRRRRPDPPPATTRPGRREPPGGTGHPRHCRAGTPACRPRLRASSTAPSGRSCV